ncbi:hypothetical protein PA598K_00533 [Paenibacillus sp. 598K]|uniref:family 16 glycoside hydrolase n=1 Tax=Paenibacillus sp. 598K TaxID=1117987 RepID=UPI000FF9DF00|nr:family 16 glycoside hydrolase [Paenibacillus sp. 598K]GBF72293.1 hypothetical protein PA598K_00533 [Paenibacillus sp. 598K]
MQYRAWAALLLTITMIWGLGAGEWALPRAYAAAPTDYYVSSSTGNDASSGTSPSTPWQTLSAVSSRVFQPGDRILLKSGDTWHESVALHGSGTASQPITLTSYGTGSRPLLRSADAAVVRIDGESGWTIAGLEIECTTTQPLLGSGGVNRGIFVNYEGEGNWSDIVIEDNVVRGGGIDTNTEGIMISAAYPTGKHSEVARHIRIRNNELYQLGWRAIGTGGWDTTLSDNLKSSALFRDVKITGNTAYQLGNQGIVMGNANHSALKWNVVHDGGQYAGSGVTWGPGGIWPITSSHVEVMFNEVYNMSDSNTGHDGSGLNIDWSNEYIVMRYNYAHDNIGNGITTMAHTNSVISDNKVQGNRGLSSIGRGQIAVSDFTVDTARFSGVKNLVMERNLILVNRPNTSAFNSHESSPGDGWSGNWLSGNNIVLTPGVSGTSVYLLEAGTAMEMINGNRIYSGSGTDFAANRNGSAYGSLGSWQAATGFDGATVLATIDTTAPTAPSSGSAAWNAGLGGVSLSWTAAADSGSGISHYNVYRSTTPAFTPSYRTLVGETDGVTFVDQQELESGVTYYYQVEAEDRNGNVSVAVSGGSATTGAISAAPLRYQASEGFGLIAQGPIWQYELWNGSGYAPIGSVYAPWSMWRDGGTYLGVGRNMQAPDSRDAVRTWTAPADGRVTLGANGQIQMVGDGPGADGVLARIMLNDTQVWPASGGQLVVYGTPVASPALTLDVLAGDKLRFIVNQRGNGMYDTVYWDPSVTYTERYLMRETFERGAARWTAHSGSWAPATEVTGAVYRQSGAPAGWTTTGSGWWSNYRLAADVKLIATDSAGGFANLNVRVQDEANKYLVYLSDVHGIAIKKVVGGVQTELASKPYAISTGTAYRVEVRVRGSAIELYIDGALQLSAEDSTYRKGRIALETYRSDAQFDNIVVEAL